MQGSGSRSLPLCLFSWSQNTTELTVIAKTFTGGPNGLSDIRMRSSQQVEGGRPTKRLKALLEEDDSSSNENEVPGHDRGVRMPDEESEIDGRSFKVNHEFARRFEHNKKREELHKREYCFAQSYRYHVLTQSVQEKYGNDASAGIRRGGVPHENDDNGTGSPTDSDEEEDDEGVLVSEALDKQIQDTLEAIRRKDPRVYDERSTFFTDLDEGAEDSKGLETKAEKPMYLNDYHRRNLLEGVASTEIEDDGPKSYAQQQDDLKNVIVKEMHAAANVRIESGVDEGESDESDDEFLVQKPSAPLKEINTIRSNVKTPKVDIEVADKDPETFLSNFMSARAWVPAAGTTFQPFESDDEEEDRRAELFEEQYNMRFEDPQASNEKLLSHARDAAAKYSVRKESPNPRKKAREAEQAKKEAARQAREEEKARYRKLKVSEVEEKIQKIKDAAGLRSNSLQEQDWSAFFDEGWDDERWEQEMRKRFGDDYYADHDTNDSNEWEGKSKRKIKKPKWEDDIDIHDLVPDFDAAEQKKPQFSLTDDESAVGEAPMEASDSQSVANSKSKPEVKKRRERDEHKKQTRLERRKIERLVDESMKVDETLSNFSKKHAGHFRYRETSPTAYGLTPHDILMASDSQLNQYAGLKKMAAFRDSEKKRKDKKRLGKKARLRQWRKETFGNEQGPQKTYAELLAGHDLADDTPKLQGAQRVDVREGKKTRSRKSKSSGAS